MNKFTKINKYFILLVAVFSVAIQLVTQTVFANGETFQNNLLKMDVYKTSTGGAKITVYTKKPYNETIVVNKKGENQYVILMPETASSLTAKPQLPSDLIQNIEVKTQQYTTGGQKGYTKILISTNKPIEITSQVQTLNNANYDLSEKDYSELIAQSKKTASKTSTAKPKVEVKKPVKPSVPTSVTQKTEKPKVASNITKKTEVKTQQKAVSVKKTVTPVVAKKQTVKQVVTKPAVKPKEVVQQSAQQATQKPAIPVESTKIEKPNETAQQVIAPEVAPVVTPVVESPVASATKPESKLQLIKRIIKENIKLASILLAVFTFFLVLLALAKKNTKKINEQSSVYPEVQDEEEDEDIIDWKEKLKAPSDRETPTSINEEQTLDDLYGVDEQSQQYTDTEADVYVEDTYTEQDYVEESIGVEGSITFDEIVQQVDDEHEMSIDELFGEDENDAAIRSLEVEKVEKVVTADEFLDETTDGSVYPSSYTVQQKEDELVKDELVKSSFAIDNTKGFYLVDVEGTTALVGYIGEEIFVLKQFEDVTRGLIQARLNEKKSGSSTFLVKINGFKAVVEVTANNMSLLIEL